MRTAAPLDYANTADQYAAILSREEATMKLEGLPSKQEWNAFGTIIDPQTVSGQSAVRHITLFAPISAPCEGGQPCRPTIEYIAPELFAQNLQPGRKIAFEFESSFSEGESKRFACEVAVTENHAKRWAVDQTLCAKCRKPAR